jgi:hypothetical protein
MKTHCFTDLVDTVSWRGGVATLVADVALLHVLSALHTVFCCVVDHIRVHAKSHRERYQER